MGGCVLLDAGIFIAALLAGDSRHGEARPVVEQARRGELEACTTVGILSEVYGALTWEKAAPRHEPLEAAEALQLLIEPPSAISVLREDADVALRAVQLAAKYQLRARRIHDARHAAAALHASVAAVYTYDIGDWTMFESDGLRITGPPSMTMRLSRR